MQSLEDFHGCAAGQAEQVIDPGLDHTIDDAFGCEFVRAHVFPPESPIQNA